MARIYLDHLASSPLRIPVRDAMMELLADGVTGNASSVHEDGRRAERIVSHARRRLAEMLGSSPAEIVFTGSGSEANNLAIKGVAEACALQGGKKHMVTSAVEHESVLLGLKSLEARGWQLTLLKVDESGRLDLREVEQAITGQTALVSVSLANHETGVIFPVREIAEIARARGALFHCDACAALGRMPVDVSGIGADLLTISAHKIGGPQGIGALYLRRGVEIAPQIHGGPQERRRRGGTESLTAIRGFGAALESLDVAREGVCLKMLSDVLKRGLLAGCLDVFLNGSVDVCPGVVNVSFDGVEGTTLLMNLDLKGFSVSSGAPCSSGSLEPSPVLLAMGLGEERARSSIRISFGHSSTEEDVELLLDVLPGIVKRLRGLRGHAAQLRGG